MIDKASFAALVMSAREGVGLSQTQLARVANVSPKTIVQLEETGVARWDAIARVAQALGQPVSEWLKMAGHTVEESRIADLLKERPARIIVPYRRFKPRDHYNAIAERIRLHGSALMCTAILSPVPLASTELNESMELLLRKELHIALLVPFPHADEGFAQRRPALSSYYTNTYNWAHKLAHRLRAMVPAAEDRIYLFRPANPSGATPLVHTPIRANELRPTFIKYSKKGNLPTRYEFGALLRILDGRPDEWVEIYSGEGNLNVRAQEAYEPWFDYCRDICEAWTPEKGKSNYNPAKLDAWRMSAK